MRLDKIFFTKDPFQSSLELVGANLCCKLQDNSVFRARICELELYTEKEKGCHAFGGKCTKRNDAMFLSGGHTYVYLCYGMYNMLNIVLDKEGVAADGILVAEVADPHIDAADREVAGAVALSGQIGRYLVQRVESNGFEYQVAIGCCRLCGFGGDARSGCLHEADFYLSGSG